MPNRKLKPRIDDFAWGRMVWLIDGMNADNPEMSLARMEVDVGHKSEAHRHSNCHECIHVLSGAITQFINGKPIELEAGDSVFIPQGAAHFTVNAGTERAILLISYSKQNREYETISEP